MQWVRKSKKVQTQIVQVVCNKYLQDLQTHILEFWLDKVAIQNWHEMFDKKINCKQKLLPT